MNIFDRVSRFAGKLIVKRTPNEICDNKTDLTDVIKAEIEPTENRIPGPNGTSLDIGYYIAKNEKKYSKVQYDITQMKETLATRLPEILAECGDLDIAYEMFVNECSSVKDDKEILGEQETREARASRR